MMIVVSRFRRVGFAEIKILLLADLHARLRTGAVLEDIGIGAQHVAIKADNALGGAGADVEAHISHAERDAAEALLVGRVHVNAIAPGADRLDAIVALAEIEFGAGERLARMVEPVEQRLAVRNDQPGDAAQHFRRSDRQMELAHADIDPHIAGRRSSKNGSRVSPSPVT